MIKKVGLFYRMPNKTVGCLKVVTNLLKGLDKLNVKVEENKFQEFTGCIHGGLPEFQKKTLPKNTLIGPEIMVLPTDMTWAWGKWKHWVQPSQWVLDYMNQFPIIKNNKLYIWPVGVDTEQFESVEKGNKEFDCLIYYKNVTKQTPITKLNAVVDFLNRRKITHRTITYGNYQEKDYINLLHKCKYMIYLAGTESQGLAYLECLSMNIPMYVMDEKTFKYSNFTFTNNNVSSAPYFDDRCGVKHPTLNNFDTFLENLENYNPREYVLDNHTVVKGAKKYLDILEKTRN